MKNLLIFTILLCTAAFTTIQAQTKSDETEIKAFTNQFMKAYNQEDVDAIQKMYLNDAVRVGTDGKETKGAEQIAALFRERFIKNKTTLKLKHGGINWSDAEHAFIATGTYEVKGATIVYDIEIKDKGTYSNTMIKEKDGQWKIARSVVTASDK